MIRRRIAPYDEKGHLRKYVLWVAVIVWLVAASALFLATREILATIEAPRCVLDPASQVWQSPPL